MLAYCSKGESSGGVDALVEHRAIALWLRCFRGTQSRHCTPVIKSSRVAPSRPMPIFSEYSASIFGFLRSFSCVFFTRIILPQLFCSAGIIFLNPEYFTRSKSLNPRPPALSRFQIRHVF